MPQHISSLIVNTIAEVIAEQGSNGQLTKCGPIDGFSSGGERWVNIQLFVAMRPKTRKRGRER